MLQVVFIDQSRDLWIRSMAGKGPTVKLASMVDCACWHDTVGMLAFIADHKLVRHLLRDSHHGLAHIGKLT